MRTPARPAPIATSVRASPQPHTDARLTPSASAPTPAPSSAIPSASGACGRTDPYTLHRQRLRPGQDGEPGGHGSRNTERQPARSTRMPPSAGSGRGGLALAAPQTPIAAARRSGGVSARITSGDAGIIAAAPAPWRPRATSRMPSVGAAAAAIDMMVNSAAPRSAARGGRRGRRSGRRARAAREHDRVDRDDPEVGHRDVGKSRCRSATARLATVASSIARNAAPGRDGQDGARAAPGRGGRWGGEGTLLIGEDLRA